MTHLHGLSRIGQSIATERKLVATWGPGGCGEVYENVLTLIALLGAQFCAGSKRRWMVHLAWVNAPCVNHFSSNVLEKTKPVSAATVPLASALAEGSVPVTAGRCRGGIVNGHIQVPLLSSEIV